MAFEDFLLSKELSEDKRSLQRQAERNSRRRQKAAIWNKLGGSILGFAGSAVGPLGAAAGKFIGSKIGDMTTRDESKYKTEYFLKDDVGRMNREQKRYRKDKNVDDVFGAVVSGITQGVTKSDMAKNLFGDIEEWFQKIIPDKDTATGVVKDASLLLENTRGFRGMINAND